MSQKKLVLWLTGLSGSGKTTLSRAITEKLRQDGLKVHHLDGDEVRAASNEKLGFNKADRDKNIKLAIELTKKYQDDGYIVVASFISPYKVHRQWGREILEGYKEVFIDAPLETCEERDPKGMYKKARIGEIKNFTGVSDPYEKPDNPDVHIKTAESLIDECVNEVIEYLKID